MIVLEGNARRKAVRSLRVILAMHLSMSSARCRQYPNTSCHRNTQTFHATRELQNSCFTCLVVTVPKGTMVTYQQPSDTVVLQAGLYANTRRLRHSHICTSSPSIKANSAPVAAWMVVNVEI
jgi:hypothetical protein